MAEAGAAFVRTAVIARTSSNMAHLRNFMFLELQVSKLLESEGRENVGVR